MCEKKEAQTETKSLQDSAGVEVEVEVGGGSVRADAEGGVDTAKKVEGVMADVAAAAAADVARAKGAAPAKVEVEVEVRGLGGGGGGGTEWYWKVLFLVHSIVFVIDCLGRWSSRYNESRYN